MLKLGFVMVPRNWDKVIYWLFHCLRDPLVIWLFIRFGLPFCLRFGRNAIDVPVMVPPF